MKSVKDYKDVFIMSPQVEQWSVIFLFYQVQLVQPYAVKT